LPHFDFCDDSGDSFGARFDGMQDYYTRRPVLRLNITLPDGLESTDTQLSEIEMKKKCFTGSYGLPC